MGSLGAVPLAALLCCLLAPMRGLQSSILLLCRHCVQD